jgi:tetratricopeptide (TPR) repeat protein
MARCVDVRAPDLFVSLDMDRLANFRSFITRSPQDPFPRYGLAMEHRTRGELAEAWVAFAELLESFPTYVPTYLMAGGTLVSLGRKEEAADIYRRGVEVASTSGDQHARRELEGALAELTPD